MPSGVTTSRSCSGVTVQASPWRAGRRDRASRACGGRGLDPGRTRSADAGCARASQCHSRPRSRCADRAVRAVLERLLRDVRGRRIGLGRAADEGRSLWRRARPARHARRPQRTVLPVLGDSRRSAASFFRSSSYRARRATKPGSGNLWPIFSSWPRAARKWGGPCRPEDPVCAGRRKDSISKPGPWRLAAVGAGSPCLQWA